MIPPRKEEIEKFAYDLFTLRGGVHGWDVADWLVAERAVKFHKNYERIAFHRFLDSSKTYLGTKEPRTCRYCGKSAPDVSFSKDAHAIPAFLGNRSVFSYYECNECNNDFSEYLEDHFAKMLHGVRTTLRIRGRKTVPSYKTPKKLTRIDVVGDRLEVSQNVIDPVADIDQDDVSARFGLETQPFVPLAVYKCLSKIAISVMPEAELRHFVHTIEWINDRDIANGAGTFKDAYAYRALTPGPLPDRYGWAQLFRRRHDSFRVPYMVLVVVCMNLTFQIYIPLCSKNQHLLGQQIVAPMFPAGINCGYEYGETEFVNMKLASPTPITSDVSVNLHAGDMSCANKKRPGKRYRSASTSESEATSAIDSTSEEGAKEIGGRQEIRATLVGLRTRARNGGTTQSVP
jgi:hypothetical protein